MPSRKNPTSRGSRGSSPRLVFEVRPCRRAAVLWGLFGLSAAVALCFSFTPDPAWRLIAPAAAVALALLPSLAMFLAKGPWAVRRFEWRPDGEWELTRPGGQTEIGRLTAATATLGPWVLLAWTAGAGGRWRLLARRYALIGVGEVGPAAFRVLTGRLSLLRGRDCGASGAVAP